MTWADDKAFFSFSGDTVPAVRSSKAADLAEPMVMPVDLAVPIVRSSVAADLAAPMVRLTIAAANSR